MRLAELCERGYFPDAVTRFGIRSLNRRRAWDEGWRNPEVIQMRRAQFLDYLHSGDVAPHGEAAKEQHYEVPTEMFRLTLGPRFKYSCCWYESPEVELAEAEETMLSLACERAGLTDGQRVLDLGCGWGSMSLWMAQQYPNSEIVAVSNSVTQKTYIDGEAKAAGLANLQVITKDVNEFDAPGKFDRVVSIEMFEHMQNYQKLLQRVRSWLNDDGALFIHIFCHREFGYRFEEQVGESDNWMGRYFFSGGVMPFFDVFDALDDDFSVAQKWFVNGQHYERTCNDWLAKFDANQAAITDLCFQTYGADDATLWVQRWRMFYMACAELFGMSGGERWGVGHYLLKPHSDS